MMGTLDTRKKVFSIIILEVVKNLSLTGINCQFNILLTIRK